MQQRRQSQIMGISQVREDIFSRLGIDPSNEVRKAPDQYDRRQELHEGISTHANLIAGVYENLLPNVELGNAVALTYLDVNDDLLNFAENAHKRGKVRDRKKLIDGMAELELVTRVDASMLTGDFSIFDGELQYSHRGLDKCIVEGRLKDLTIIVCDENGKSTEVYAYKVVWTVSESGIRCDVDYENVDRGVKGTAHVGTDFHQRGSAIYGEQKQSAIDLNGDRIYSALHCLPDDSTKDAEGKIIPGQKRDYHRYTRLAGVIKTDEQFSDLKTAWISHVKGVCDKSRGSRSYLH